MIHIEDTSTSFDSFDDYPDLISMQCWNVLQFYQLRGKCTVMIKENIEPIPDLQYCIFSPPENKYYLRTSKGYDLDYLYFYRPTLTFSGEDITIENLRRYVYDENVYLLFTKEQAEEIKTFLQRLWKSRFTTEGTVRYKDYINLLDQSLKFEDYKEYASGLTGHKTVTRQFEMRIKAIWDNIYKKNIS